MENNNGWIKFYRKTKDNPIIMKDADHLAIWAYLLLCATHTEYPALFKGEKIMLQPGQLLTGRKSIAGKLGINESKVRRVLDAFENDQQIDRQSSNQNTLISLKNWDNYQCFDQQNDQQTTNERPTSDQRATTNKNNKNNKKDKNKRIIYSDNPILNDSIVAFVEHRKNIRKPMTDNAMKLMLSKLNKLSSDVDEQIEILNQSILNGWTGIFPLKQEAKGKKEVVPDWMKNKNKFNNFHQRDYDYEELEGLLLNSQPATAATDESIRARAEALKKSFE